MEVQEKKADKNLLNKGIDFIFSNDIRKYLLLIVIFGAILRFIVARNISALGDEMVHGPHAIGFLHSGLLSTIAHSPLWFYLTDIFFKVLGVTMFSTRFLSFFYGTLSILVIYLISLKIFNKKTALISSFLLSISFFTIRYTLIEMDLAAIFFLLLAIYSFFISLEKNKFPYLAAVCIGLASLIKTLSLFFVPAFLVGFFLFNKSKSEIKSNLKKAFFFGLLILLIFSPILIHNYLWYKDKGMVDVYFARYFYVEKVLPFYASQQGYNEGIMFSRFFEGVFAMSSAIFFLDPLISIFGILGFVLFFILKEKRQYLVFLVVFQLSGFILLILSDWLATHFTTMIPLLCIFGGFFIDKFSLSFKKIDHKKILAISLLIILIFQLYMLWPHLTSRCALCQMRDYASENLDKNSIVLADARIYRGRIAWLFYDFHYLESSYLPNILEINKNLSGQDIPIKLYFVECVRDDCGWGTITAGQLNDSSESIVNSLSSIQPEKIILGGGGYDEETGKPYFKVYQAAINLKPQLINTIDSTHEWFYYPVNYIPEDKIFDKYEVYGVLDNFIYLIAWIIIISSIILSIILAFVPFYKIYRENETFINYPPNNT